MSDPRNHPLHDFLECSPEYLAASELTVFRICNGCGSAKAKFDFVPDSIYGLSITPACYIHDWDYNVGSTLRDKEIADRRLLNNMLTLIDMQTGWHQRVLKPLRRWRAMTYYTAVRDMGHSAFWAGKKRPQ